LEIEELKKALNKAKKHVHGQKFHFSIEYSGQLFINWSKLLTETAGSYPKFYDYRSISIFHFSFEMFSWDLNNRVHGRIT